MLDMKQQVLKSQIDYRYDQIIVYKGLSNLHRELAFTVELCLIQIQQLQIADPSFNDSQRFDSTYVKC